VKLPSDKRMMLFSGSANVPLAEDVAEILGVTLGGVQRSVFANGEIYVRFTESVRGAHCFVLQSHSRPVNFHVMEQLLMIDALRRASALRITAVIPYFGYARQDKKVLPREPISARLMGDLFGAAGADRIVSVDLHTGQIQGFVSKPFDALTALPVFVEYLLSIVHGDMTVVSPDSGRVKLAERYARHIPNSQVAFVHKRRSPDEHNVSEALEIIGDVADRHAVIVDDIIDTGGTVVAAAELLRERGALSVTVMATHGVFSPPAVDRFKNAPIEEVVVTNTLPTPEDALELDKLTVLSAAPLIADTLRAIFTDESVSEIFMGENV
jgi:ribose-phosphate pyrophosphokinase